MSNQSAIKQAWRATKTVIVNGSEIVITSAQRIGEMAPGVVEDFFDSVEDFRTAAYAAQDEFWEFDGFTKLSREERDEIIRSKILSKDLPKTMEEWRAKQAEEAAKEAKNQKKESSGSKFSNKDSSKEEKKNQSVKVETSSSKEDERIVAIEKDINNLKANVEEIVSFIRKVQEQANQQ